MEPPKEGGKVQRREGKVNGNVRGKERKIQNHEWTKERKAGEAPGRVLWVSLSKTSYIYSQLFSYQLHYHQLSHFTGGFHQPIKMKQYKKSSRYQFLFLLQHIIYFTLYLFLSGNTRLLNYFWLKDSSWDWIFN